MEQVMKPELPYIETIIQRLMTAYLEPTNRSPWFVAYSNGKDSSCMAYCIWRAVERVPAELRTRPVYFATSDTLLEHPDMKSLMTFSHIHMNEVAKETGLPIEAFLVQPEKTIMMKMIGDGNPLPTPVNKVNRYCTDLAKIKPMEKLQQRLIELHGSLILMLGTRTEESQKRAKSIRKHSVEGQFIFPKVGDTPNKEGQYTKYTCHPIVDLNEEEVWRCITYARILPWKTKATTIRKMYEGAGECPIQVDKAFSKPCGGSSRNGCMICMMASGNGDDQMLQAFIDKGEEWAVHMNRLRKLIRDSLYDSRFRRPINKWRSLKMDWANPFVHDFDQKEQEWAEAKKKKDTMRAFEEQMKAEKEAFGERSEGLCHDSSPVYPNLGQAGYTLEARIFLLKAVLYTQEVTGIELVSPRELAYIKEAWKERCQWVEKEEDLRPEFPHYEGALVLNPDYSINPVETTIPNLTLYYDSVDKETGETVALPPIEMNKMNPPVRKNSKNKQTKAEYIAELNKPYAKTINVQPNVPNRMEVFCVVREWGYDEKRIVQHLESSLIQTGTHIPYFWLPCGSREQRLNWDTLEEREHIVHWNAVTFIVCRPSIQTKEQAGAFVDWYIEQGTTPVKEIKIEEAWAEQYKHYATHSPEKAKQLLLQNAEDPDYVPASIKEYADISNTELEIARTMRYNGQNREAVQRDCKDYGYVWMSVAGQIVEGLKAWQARIFLLERGYHPNVLPTKLKQALTLHDKTMQKACTLKWREGKSGVAFWKEFYLPYVCKGMSYTDIMGFFIQQGFLPVDVPAIMKDRYPIQDSLLTLAFALREKGCPTDTVMKHLEPYLLPINQKQHEIA